MAKALKKPKKNINGYKMPDPLPHGEILTDVAKNQWKLGASIGKGGFGEIYSAQEASKASSMYPFVVKVEPHVNGPLFVEMHFYMKNAKQADINAFMKKHKLKTFGMPAYLGSGSHKVGASRYRFIVMEKFGSDLDKLRHDNKGVLPSITVFQLAWQITYVLEYIHELGYVHADIKGGNVLLGATPNNKNQAYLLDFGLATKFTTDKEFKPNPKKAHDGTIEYLSCDAHHGVPTRRGDFEILAYNLIHWLGGNLPWESKLGDPQIVHQIKQDNLNDIAKFVRSCLKKNQETIVKLLQYATKLKFDEKPDYNKIRTLFETEIQKNGATVYTPLDLSGARKRRSAGDELDSDQAESRDNSVEVKKPARKREKKEKENQEIEVMTEAMKEVLAKKKEKEADKKKKTQSKKEKTDEAGEKKKTQSKKEKTEEAGEFDGYTAEMIEVKMRKMNNEKKKASPRTVEQKDGARPKRNLPLVNYDEKTPKPMRKKY